MLARTDRFIRPTREYRELSILSEIDRNPHVSQRALARAASLSLAVVNEYLDDLARLELIRIDAASPRQYRYGLTPLGRNRRNELFFAVSREVIRFYGRVKEEFRRRLLEFSRQGIRRVVLFGAAETGELVAAACAATPLEVVGLVDSDPAKQGRRIAGVPIGSPDTIRTFRPDAVIITSFGHTEEIWGQIKDLDREGILVLRLSEAP